MNRPLRFLFFGLIVRPLVLIIIGIHLRYRERLPKGGPAIVCANHNSHLDTLVLMSLFPLRQLSKLRPVAAADYWLRPGLISWFSLNIIGIIPLARQNTDRNIDPLSGCREALDRGDILLLFPEGSRGEAEVRSPLRKGVARLVETSPDVSVSPIFLYGLGKSLPKGQGLFVPFFCDAFVGDPITWREDRHLFMEELEASMNALAGETGPREWE